MHIDPKTILMRADRTGSFKFICPRQTLQFSRRWKSKSNAGDLIKRRFDTPFLRFSNELATHADLGIIVFPE
jgi:hypothetical protein